MFVASLGPSVSLTSELHIPLVDQRVHHARVERRRLASTLTAGSAATDMAARHLMTLEDMFAVAFLVSVVHAVANTAHRAQAEKGRQAGALHKGVREDLDE